MLDFLTSNATAIGASLALLTILGVLLRWGGNIVAWLGSAASRWVHPATPRNTLRVVEHRNPPWWHMGKSGGGPAMQIVCEWYVTNVSARPARVLSARMMRPKVLGHVTTRHPDGGIHGDWQIEPGATTEIAVDFWVEPPVCAKGDEFKATVALVDQFGNEHKVKDVVFSYR